MNDLYLRLMQAAIEVTRKGIAAGQSPFGTVIATKDGEIVCANHNVVRLTTDPTAHAEVTAIRAAAKKLNNIDMTGHILVSTCEPCPMCASAIHWARFDAVIYGATIADAEQAGFNELAMPIDQLYKQGGSGVKIVTGVLQRECAELFQVWKRGPNPATY